MIPNQPIIHDDFDGLIDNSGEAEKPSDQDLWFLPSPMEEEPDYLGSGIRAESVEMSIITD